MARRSCKRARQMKPRFDAWFRNSVSTHKAPGYAIVTLSLKPEGGPPGDATSEQMDAIADLADRYSFGEIRVGHEQNLVLPHVPQRDLPALWEALDTDRRRHAERRPRLRHHRLPRSRLLQPRQHALDPGGAGADAAVPQISTRSARSAACTSTSPAASTPAATITSAISASSASRRTARSSSRSRSAAAPTSRRELGALLGPAVPYGEVADVVEDVVAAYIELRERPNELFVETVKRIGVEPFKERVYAAR